MPTLIGHAIPGVFFSGFALHWTIQIWIRYFKCKRNQEKFYNSCTYPCSCFCGCFKTYQVESVFKVLFLTIGLIIEIVVGYADGTVSVAQGQHSTMYCAFIVAGILDLLIHHKVRFIPKNADYMASFLAFTIEVILFKFHLHGRSSLDVQLHTLLVYVAVLSAISLLAEMRYPNSVLTGLARSFSVGLQGTWLIQIGYILYYPSPDASGWDGENHEQMMITTIIFGWHMLIILIAIITIGAIVSRFFRYDYSKNDGSNLGLIEHVTDIETYKD
ncbi:transmembrane protein 45B-like [Tubulanus polymorphus]|uniref:transmembrane protein 45B-like n=1 Tax=Tubulanus polymorphus TaxID=672921 RepID=UPI003DA31AFB